MTTWEAVAYGAIQGLTEYLPVSSSAHLILLPKFMNWQDPGLAFDVFIHAGTLLATLIYFRKDWFLFFQGKSDVKFIHVVLGTLPVLVVGFLVHDWVETIFRGTHVIASALFMGGALLWVSDLKGSKSREVEQLSAKDAFVIGLLQCCSLVPGFSRSGSTIMGGLFLGLSRPASARFSFLLSAPVTGAALLYELKKLVGADVISTVGLFELLLATGASFIFGIMAIAFILKWLRGVSYGVFTVYRTLLAISLFL